MGFLKFLLARDSLGHDISINYQGSDKYNTYLGSIISISIYMLVLVQLATKMVALINMTDPQISSLTRPIYNTEVDEFGNLTFVDHRFNFGIYLRPRNQDFENSTITIPASLGRVVFRPLKIGPFAGEYEWQDAISCADLFQDVNIDVDEFSLAAKDAGYCVDPDQAQVAGTANYGSQWYTEMAFLSCQKDSSIEDKRICMDNEGIVEWIDARKPTISTVFSFSFLDLESTDKPVKTTVTTEFYGQIDYSLSHEV